MLRKVLCLVLAAALWSAGATLLPFASASAVATADDGTKVSPEMPCPDMGGAGMDASCHGICAHFVAIEVQPSLMPRTLRSTDYVEGAVAVVSVRLSPDPGPPRTLSI